MTARVKDPLNVVIAGVGGQGNVLMSRILGRALLQKGYKVTIADDIGASQRAGAVVSKLRIARKYEYGPLIPAGHGHVVVGLEPMETLRMLVKYGHPGVSTLTNLEPILPAGVLNRKDKYPESDQLRRALEALSGDIKYVEASALALQMGAIIITNVVMLGALAGTGWIPLTRQEIAAEIKNSFPLSRLELNLNALEQGFNAIKNC
jgi:indolepyruvate ferredoxin oxidoreductase, beta subunit